MNKSILAKIKFYIRWFLKSFIWVVPLLIIIDFASKLGMEKYLSNLPSHSKEIIPGFFYFTLRYNKDIAWSIPVFGGKMWAYAIVSAVGAILMVGYLYWKRKKLSFGSRICIYAMLAGCLGNFIDRAFYGERGVIDFLDFIIFGYDFPVFNIADSSLVVGVLALAVLMFVADYKVEKEKRQQGAKSPDQSSISEEETGIENE